MLAQSLRAARPLVARIATASSRRAFTPAASRKADLVQDLYLNSIKAYKPNPVGAKDSEGHVQKFSVPAAPKSPEEADLANDLKTYETQAVEVEGSSGSSGESAQEITDEWFEEEEEAAPAAAH